jgi:glutamine amidotransferase-like uncharacterized protein
MCESDQMATITWVLDRSKSCFSAASSPPASAHKVLLEIRYLTNFPWSSKLLFNSLRRPDDKTMRGTGAGPAIALVYYDSTTDCCSQALADLLAGHPRYHFQVIFVGPKTSISPAAGLTMRGVRLYAQPGGGGDYRDAYRAQRMWAAEIRRFVRSGGRYLGVCMGGYLAASDAFNLFSGEVEDYVSTRRAVTSSTADTVIPILWRGRPRYMYFQDGAAFSHGPHGTKVVATYTNGLGAAVISPCGKGRVGLLGPHPEATPSWYSAHGLTDPDGPDADLGYDFIAMVMQ